MSGGAGGLQINQVNNTATTINGGIDLEDVRYERGAARGGTGYGVTVTGDAAAVRLTGLRLDGGDLALQASTQRRFAIAAIEGPAAKNDVFVVPESGASGRIAAAAEGVLVVSPPRPVTFDAAEAVHEDGVRAGRVQFATGGR